MSFTARDGTATHSPEQVKKLIFTTGKIYYDIRDQRDEAGLSNDIAIARIEQVLFLFRVINSDLGWTIRCSTCSTNTKQFCTNSVYELYQYAIAPESDALVISGVVVQWYSLRTTVQEIADSINRTYLPILYSSCKIGLKFLVKKKKKKKLKTSRCVYFPF